MRKAIIITIVLSGLISCQKESPIPDEAIGIVQQWMVDSEIPGLAIAISRDGEMVWSAGYGYSEMEHMVPVYPDLTRFRIGSISKSLTAAGLGILMDQGKIDLIKTASYPSFQNAQARQTSYATGEDIP